MIIQMPVCSKAHEGVSHFNGAYLLPYGHELPGSGVTLSWARDYPDASM